MKTVNLAIVGAGQAGLSLSYELCRARIDHVVFDRARPGESWRRRWDSFRLVTPNWSVQVPGGEYRGDDPDGFMPGREVAAHLERYAENFRAPLLAGVDVLQVERSDDGTFALKTSAGDFQANRVVLASGAYQKPHRPSALSTFPPSLRVIDAEQYTNPHELPPGPLLVIGSGQTGCQIAEELFKNERETYLACGRAPWVPRRLAGRDIMAWLIETRFVDTTSDELPSLAARLGANVQNSGGNGGHDLNYRTLQALGVRLLGRFAGCEDGVAHFANDVAESVAFGYARYLEVRAHIEKWCAQTGTIPPVMETPPPFLAEYVPQLRLSEFGAVIFTSGFRPDYARWVMFPEAFDDFGFPIQRNGSSTVVSGLHFMGVHYQRKRKSATLYGVAEDAAVLAENLTSAPHTRGLSVFR